MNPCLNPLSLVEVTLDNELQGHYCSAKLTDLSLEYHPTLLGLMLVLMFRTMVFMVGSAVAMLGTIVLMVGFTVLLVGSIVPMIQMWMSVRVIRSYMLTGCTLPVRPGLVANIRPYGSLRHLGDLYLMIPY